jgi:hypothetical protein
MELSGVATDYLPATWLLAGGRAHKRQFVAGNWATNAATPRAVERCERLRRRLYRELQRAERRCHDFRYCRRPILRLEQTHGSCRALGNSEPESSCHSTTMSRVELPSAARVRFSRSLFDGPALSVHTGEVRTTTNIRSTKIDALDRARAPHGHGEEQRVFLAASLLSWVRRRRAFEGSWPRPSLGARAPSSGVKTVRPHARPSG